MHKHRLKTTWTSSTNLPLHPDLHSCSWAHCPPPRLYIGSIQLSCSIFTHQQWALHPLLPQARAMGWAPRPRLAASSLPGTRRVEPRRRLLLPLLPQRVRPRRYASAGIQRGLRVAPRPPWPGRWKRSCPRTCCVWRWGGGQGAGGLRSCLREREVKGGRAGPGLAAGPLGADGAVLAARSRRAAAVLPRWGLRLCRHLGAPRWGRGISTSYISAQGCCSGTASVFCVLCAMLLHTYKHVCLVLSFRLGLQLSELLCSNFTSKGLLRWAAPERVWLFIVPLGFLFLGPLFPRLPIDSHTCCSCYLGQPIMPAVLSLRSGGFRGSGSRVIQCLIQ